MSDMPTTTNTPTITRSAHWRVIFTNFQSLGFSENDVRLIFGFDLDMGQPGRQILEEAVVVMTPRTAKLLAHSLNIVISTFEAANGPIPVPADKFQKLDAEIAVQVEAHKKKRAEEK